VSPSGLVTPPCCSSWHGGRERSLDEFAALFEKAGFRLEAETPTATGFSVIAATAVE